MYNTSTPQHRWVVLALWALSVLPWFWSTTHLDIARDLVHANAIAQGQFIGRGPIIGGLFYLAPYWFYAVALPLIFGLGWLAGLLWIAVLAGLKFPLAYHYFNRQGNPRAGLIACCLLFWLGWVQHQWLVPTHTVMAPAAALALLLVFTHLAEQMTRWKMTLAGAFFGLCFHAHPTILPMGVLVFWSLHQHNLSWGPYLQRLLGFALAALLVVTPILFLSQSGEVTYTPSTFMAYLSGLEVWQLLQKVPLVFQEIFWGEFGYLTKVNPTADVWVFDALRWLLVLAILLLGYMVLRHGTVVWQRQKHLLLTWLVMVAFVFVIREQVTFYMIWAASTVLVVLLASVLSQARFKPTVCFIMGFSVLHWLLLALLLVHHQHQGSTHFDFARMYGFSQDNRSATPVYMISAGDRDAIARLNCAADQPVIHGALLNNLVFDYQGGERLHCPAQKPRLAGTQGSRHLTFLPVAMATTLGLTAGTRIGGIQYQPSQPLYPPEPIAIGTDFQTYLPRNDWLDQSSEHSLAVSLTCQQLLVVHHAFHFLAPMPEVVVQQDQIAVAPLAFNANTRVYGCESEAANPFELVVTLRGRGVPNMDVTVLDRP
ncbi:hypothetical protein [Marinicella meishanensis]|uniref:hypothetical protein n=1 Tax=Marinicella meishanensis TaxID=2873263 RepID=UPI001CBF762A|nr:hypothetical protein [Marinicella sp. NBU2979]